MLVIAGCVIVKDNEVLMVQEAQEKCYGQWNYPAGHVDNMETIMEAGVREAFEETGCEVKLTGFLPIYSKSSKDGTTSIHIRFTAEIINENIKFDTNEILDVKWIDIETMKNMSKDVLRSYDINIQFMKDFENGKIYPLEILDNKMFKE